MEDKVYLTKKSQVDLMTDPLCLAIINLIGKKPVTKEWIAEQLDEKQNFINKCLVELVEQDLLILVEEDGAEKYGRRAKTLEVDKSLVNEANEYWASGILNHIENEVAEILQLSKGDNREELLNELGYKNFHISTSNLMLTQEEFDEFQEVLDSFTKRHQDEEETDELKKYGLAVVLYPNVPRLKSAIREKKNK